MEDYKKKYEEALERAKFLKENTDGVGAIDISRRFEEIFPELKESEDKEEELTEFEKNLQIIISEASYWTSDDGSISTYCQFGDKEIKKISRQLLDLAKKELKDSWLEKQGEQKPAWSEEDENRFRNLIYLVEHSDEGKGTKEGFVKFINRLKSFKDRVLPQSKQEWSGGDEAHLHSLMTHLEQWIERHPNTTGADVQGENISWLKSLKDRYTWKPSNEQMEALWDSIPENVKEISEREMLLGSLYQDLKKLRKE